jgi:hypothetical protein
VPLDFPSPSSTLLLLLHCVWWVTVAPQERKQQQQWKDRRAAVVVKRLANREVAREARFQRNLKYMRLPEAQDFR